jgi:hypothetical protein
MIVCNDKKDYEILHSLRAHGWDRGLIQVLIYALWI